MCSLIAIEAFAGFVAKMMLGDMGFIENVNVLPKGRAVEKNTNT